MSSLRRLVVFGDSFVEGYYNSKEEGRGVIANNFVHHFRELLGVEVLSRGKNGSSNLAISNQVMTHIRNTDKETCGPDTMYVVDLIENGQVVESRKLPGKSMSYVNDVCENWNNGIIQLLVD